MIYQIALLTGDSTNKRFNLLLHASFISCSLLHCSLILSQFRMKLCGVANPVYLVEDYGDTAHCKVSQKGLYQAITNTQVKLMSDLLLCTYFYVGNRWFLY